MYAYGVVLLEMLTAAEVVDTKRPAAHHNVVDWLYSKLHDLTTIREVHFHPLFPIIPLPIMFFQTPPVVIDVSFLHYCNPIGAYTSG